MPKSLLEEFREKKQLIKPLPLTKHKGSEWTWREKALPPKVYGKEYEENVRKR
jgi:hypothetical protein